MRHFQTLWGAVLRPVDPPPLRRQRLETPDGDFIDLDWADGPPGAPLLIVLHGLEGSSRSKPVLALLAAARRAGWQAAALNFRSCSGELNRLRRSYHAGETSDLAFALDQAASYSPGSPLLCAGLSLGGNVLLKFLGERGESLTPRLRAAAAVSTPFDLARSVRAIEHGFSRVYMTRLVRALKRKTFAKLKKFPDLVDRRKLAAVRTLAEFDEWVTAPVHGFENADAYWKACSSAHFLAGIRRPTLLLNAQDDPFLPEEALPRERAEGNRFLTADFPPAGGHLGFYPGGRMEERTIGFLRAKLET